MSVPDDMTDERWAVEAEKIGDGWAPGRVPITGDGGVDGDPAFGWLRGAFGIFEGNADTNFGYMKITSLTHLKTGYRIAYFNLPEYAVTAAILAERVGDWSALKADDAKKPKWRAAAQKMYQLWGQAGLFCSPIATSYNDKPIWCGAEPITAAARAALATGK